MSVKHRRQGLLDRQTGGWLAPGWLLGTMAVGVSVLASCLPAIADAPTAQPTLRTRSNAPILAQNPVKPPTVSPIAFQGQQIVWNGRTVNAAWAQWQTAGRTRIGLTDAALMQNLGLRLLSTSDRTQQPIDWFGDPRLPQPRLATQLVPPVRYLDITDLAAQRGWRLQVTGSTLQITTPSAQVLGVRQGKQPWGDRLVIDLDRPTPYQVDPQSQELVISLDAKVDAKLLQTFKPVPGSLFKTLKLESQGDRTLLRVGVPLTQQSRILTLSQPARLVLDLGTVTNPDLDIAWANGLRWRQQTIAVGSAQFPTIWFEVDPRQAGVRLLPVIPNGDTLAGTAILLQTALRSQAAAAINGGFFNRSNQLPLGAIRINGQWRSGPILNRGVVAWNQAGDFRFDRYTLQETARLANGQQFPLVALNSAYVKAGISRYTSDWGPTYTTLADNEILVTVQNGQVSDQRTAGKAGETVTLPTGSAYLLVFRSNRTAANAFAVGTAVQIDRAESVPGLEAYPEMIGGGPLLIQNRQIVLDPAAEQFSLAYVQERAARSAIGRTADGKVLIVAVHDRLGGSGPSFSEMAAIMQQLGAVDALNLDGGSSTTLYLGGQLLDRPPRSSARVHDAIGVFLNP